MATLTPRQRPSFRNLAQAATSTPTMLRKAAGITEDIEVGDVVEVPGGMDGTVKFVGEVRGKQGTFVGVELSKKWASRGKNDGDAEGIRYFSTSVPGAGIFLPLNRAVKRSSPANSLGSVPASPTTPPFEQFAIHEHEEVTPTPPPVAAPSRFSKSVSARAASPAFRPKSRPSLPRPESPLRRSQAAPPLPPGSGARPSLNMLPQNRLPGPRYAASPTPAKTPAKSPSKSASVSAHSRPRPKSRDDEDEINHLRAVIQEKNDKIAALTAEFDSHRADFRSTLDTLDMASTETERVYEKKVQELMEERQMLLAQSEDVESVASQLRQLEEVVQELEEGLEDARRGEAEARGEVEFLRGEVERVRAELRREREKNQDAALGIAAAAAAAAAAKSTTAATGGATKSATTTEPGAEGASRGSALNESAITKASFSRHVASASAHSQPRSPPEPLSHLIVEPTAALSPAPLPVTTDGEGEGKWCALCEQDGHDSISCPLDT